MDNNLLKTWQDNTSKTTNSGSELCGDTELCGASMSIYTKSVKGPEVISLRQEGGISRILSELSTTKGTVIQNS
jgi:hypothetical protein